MHCCYICYFHMEYKCVNYINVVPCYSLSDVHVSCESVIFAYEATFVVDGIHKLTRGRRHYELQGLRQEILPSCCKCLLNLTKLSSSPRVLALLPPWRFFFKKYLISGNVNVFRIKQLWKTPLLYAGVDLKQNSR